MKEHDAAVAAVAAAKTGGADLYAVDDLAAAEAALKHYDEFVSQRDYKQALSSALDASDRALDATRASAAKQTSLRAEAAELQRTLDAALSALDAQLKAPRPKTSARTAAALRQTRKIAAAAMQEARKDLEAGRLTSAIKRLVAANADVKRDSSRLEDDGKKLKK